MVDPNASLDYSDIGRLEAENKRLREALRTISEHRHCEYTNGSPYATGVSDGHRCAAMLAKDTLTYKPD